MRPRLYLFFILLISPVPGHTEAKDQLWEQSLDLFSSNTHWHPKTMMVRTNEYNDLGELKSTTYTEIEYHVDKEGELESEILQAVKDGKDITEKQKRGRRKEGNPFMASPFNPEYQDSVEVTPTDRTKRVGDSRCRGYDLSMEYEKNRYTGTAWLDVDSGAPLLLVLEMKTLPRFLDTLTMTFHYIFKDSGTWYAAKIEMEGSGTILFQKKIFTSVTILKNHFMYPSPGDAR